MIQVIIADDHIIVRQGLKRILSDNKSIGLVGEAGSIQEFEDLMRKVTFDVLILDLSLQGKNGFEALSQIKCTHPQLAILILSDYPKEHFALRALKAGASGYLSKKCDSDQIMDAIQTIYQKKRYITPEVAELLTNYLSTELKDQPSHAVLSNREFQVLLLVGSGMSLTEMAKKFNVSVKTISTYRLRILEKMKMKTNAELIQYIIKNELKSG